MSVLLMALAGAFGFRIRGDEIVGKLLGGPSTNVGRLIWALSISGMAAILYGPMALFLIPAFFVGAIPGWFDSIDMGRNENSFERDFYVMMFRGVLFTMPAGIVLHFLGFNPMLFAWSGVLCPLIYSICWLIPIKNRWVGQGTPLAETVFGAYVGSMLALTMGNVL